jgi:hypothetical protein
MVDLQVEDVPGLYHRAMVSTTSEGAEGAVGQGSTLRQAARCYSMKPEKPFLAVKNPAFGPRKRKILRVLDTRAATCYDHVETIDTPAFQISAERRIKKWQT